MRSVSSAFWLALQDDNLTLCELVDLSYNGVNLRWTTSNAPLVNSGNTYDPFPGTSEQGAEESVDLAIGTIGFGVVNSGSINTLLVGGGLERANIVVRRVFTNSPNLGSIHVFRGKLGDITYNRDFVSGQVRDMFNGVQGQWPYHAYQDGCTWRFGSTGCGFNTTSITFTGSCNVTSSTPMVVWAAAGTLANSYAPHRLSRGKFTFTTGPNSGISRAIRTNTGDMVILSHPVPYAVNSGTIGFSIYPGCRKRLIDDCHSLYNNTEQAMAFPWMPKNESAFS